MRWFLAVLNAGSTTVVTIEALDHIGLWGWLLPELGCNPWPFALRRRAQVDGGPLLPIVATERLENPRERIGGSR